MTCAYPNCVRPEAGADVYPHVLAEVNHHPFTAKPEPSELEKRVDSLERWRPTSVAIINKVFERLASLELNLPDRLVLRVTELHDETSGEFLRVQGRLAALEKELYRLRDRVDYSRAHEQYAPPPPQEHCCPDCSCHAKYVKKPPQEQPKPQRQHRWWMNRVGKWTDWHDIDIPNCGASNGEQVDTALDEYRDKPESDKPEEPKPIIPVPSAEEMWKPKRDTAYDGWKLRTPDK